MTRTDNEPTPQVQGYDDAALETLKVNMARIDGLAKRLSAAIAQRKDVDSALNGPSNDVYIKAASAYFAEMMQNPAKMIEHQMGYWTKTLTHYVEAQQLLAKGETPPEALSNDRRFQNPLWQNHPFFSYVKQQYLINADTVQTALADMPGMEGLDKQRAGYFISQIVDMFSPANFLALNPDALEKAVETQGESLVRGLENLVRDIEANNGQLLVTLSDPDAFRLGENIATTPGAVVYRNSLCELIQYSPTTPQVHETPLLIFPPWINKYYVLDLKVENSLIKWIVDQGYTLFVVSWVNPDSSYAQVSLDDYIRDGFLQTMAEVRRICGVTQINTVGYCIAGTTLALSLAHLQRCGDESVKSATFFTTLTDFSDPGEVGVFLDDSFVDGIERQAQKDGVLSKLFMGRTFSFLRSNDLIYQPAIKSYMLGEAPPAFDLLYWNGDGTNLPACMSIEYLRDLCQRDSFALGTLNVLGAPVSLQDVRVPLCAIACETDHIAHWRGSYNGIRQMKSEDKTFILSQSGHISGIINPPRKDKYGHYVNESPMADTPDEWLEGASFNRGSWWPRWEEWLRAKSGAKVAARALGGPENPVLCPAPGTYVKAPAPKT